MATASFSPDEMQYTRDGSLVCEWEPSVMGMVKEEKGFSFFHRMTSTSVYGPIIGVIHISSDNTTSMQWQKLPSCDHHILNPSHGKRLLFSDQNTIASISHPYGVRMMLQLNFLLLTVPLYNAQRFYGSQSSIYS